MKRLSGIILMTLALASCGRVETPEEFFDLTGKQGDTGLTGQDGIDGKDGIDGVDGIDGIDGIDGSFDGRLEYVEICRGASTQNYIETLVLLDGAYLAFYSDRDYKKQRLVILVEDKRYRTTDGRNQIFKVTNGQLICEE